VLRYSLFKEEGDLLMKVQSEKGKLGKDLNLFFLTWPIFLEVFLFMLMGIADTLMLSAISDNSVSGVGAANQYLHIAILIMEVIGNGASIVVAQYIGARKFKDAAKISALAITLNLLMGLVISGLFILFGGSLLEGLNLKGEVLAYAKNYLAIVGGFIFLQALINSLAAIIRVHGHTKEAMLVSLGMNIFHVAGNYLLIFGNFGFPEMGVQGAAVSTVISRFLALIVFFWLLYRIMDVRVKLKYYFALSKEFIGKFLKLASHPLSSKSCTRGARLSFCTMLPTLGKPLWQPGSMLIMSRCSFICLP
jgi:Na+-driven multidrug efflux pump